MCNKLHPNYTKIPKEGVGYKIFLKTKDGYKAMCAIDQKNKNQVYKYGQTGWVHWIPSMMYFGGHGFCIFLSREEAERCMANFSSIRNKNPTVLQIQYKEGLGTHLETQMVTGRKYRIAIVKQFYCKELIEHGGRKYPLGALDPKDKEKI